MTELRDKNALQNLIDVLDVYTECRVLITKADSDARGREINRQIEQHVERHKKRAYCCTSLGQLGYLSAIKYASAVVGISFSGILEGPVLKTLIVNNGVRQKGRLRYPLVIVGGLQILRRARELFEWERNN